MTPVCTKEAEAAAAPVAVSHDIPRFRDPYLIINEELASLVERPADTATALAVCQAYVQLGLFGPARELLTDPAGPLYSLTECQVLARQIAARPSGRIAWGGLQRRFEENLERLYEAKPDLRRHDAAFRCLPRACELYRAADGAILLSTRDARGRRWLPDALNTEKLAAGFKPAHSETDALCGNYVVSGDRFFTLLGRIFTTTSTMLLGFAPRIIVVEPDFRTLAAGLYVRDTIEPLLHSRTHVFAGERCLDELAAYLEAHPRVNPPSYQVLLPTSRPGFREQFAETLNVLVERRQALAHAAIEESSRLYSAVDRQEWRRRFQSADRRPLRILGITSRFTTVLQYAMRDLKTAFERKGHAFHTLIEPTDHDLLDGAAFARAVADFRPDLIFVIDHHRAEYPRVLPANIPYVCWIQDMLPNLTNRQAGLALSPLDFYIAPSICQLARPYGYPATQGMIWTTATDLSLYSSDPLPAAELDPYRCDFSYVSNQSTPPQVFHDTYREATRATAESLRLIDAVFELLRNEFREKPSAAGTRPATQVLEEAVAATGCRPLALERRDLLARTYVHPLAELMFRQTALEWVADYCAAHGRTLRLFGRGWERHPRFAPYAAGSVANGRPLRAAYQATTINLQINGYGAVHPRLLDGLAAGGFFLIRQAPFDLLAEPVRRLLQAVERHSICPDREYPEHEVPDFASAIHAVEQICGQRPAATPRIAADDLDHYFELAADNFRRTAAAAFTRYAEVSFGSKDSFFGRAQYFLERSRERSEIALEMRDQVVRTFSYDALVERVLRFIPSRL